MKLVPVILSGGSGTRLWPLSRSFHPKQFLSLTTSNSMFQDTCLRLRSITGLDFAHPIVVCNDEHRFLVAEQLRELELEHSGIFLEPVGRNTAPAVAVAAMQAISEDEDAVLLVLPADHVIGDVEAFSIALERAAEEAIGGALVTFGIIPSKPHTGYGYIKRGASGKRAGVHDVDAFIEKPDAKTAEAYLKQGDYVWNGGMFMFQASNYLDIINQFEPDIFDSARLAFDGSKPDLDFVRLDRDSFANSPSISIDYAVMERAVGARINTKVVSLEAGWSDVGSWGSLLEVCDKDEDGNAKKGDIITHETSDCLLMCDKGILATSGVKELIVVRTADAVLVADKNNSQHVKIFAERLIDAGREEAQLHRRVSRPWGTYECIDEDDNFKVKRIVVNVGAKLSLQLHYKRAEHWVVVKGVARVTKGDEVFDLGENESTYIPIETKHSLENHGDIPLEIIEVQSGTYLGEDDIVRFEDRYGRSN